MEIIGLIAEYNPFHNGHLYQLQEIKKLYPDSLIILVLNGYFLERGTVSVETKEEKTKLALKYGVDIVIELPFVFGTNSADIFAESSLELLNNLSINKLVFGSESNEIEKLKSIAKKQLDKSFDEKVKIYLDEGINYPTALNKALGTVLNEPNDLLGVSYIKAIYKNKYDIEPISIKRTNDYHDIESDESIVSASNIREKLKENKNIEKYIPEGKLVNINEKLLFNILKYKILTDNHLDEYLSVDEGLDNRLKKVINDVNSIEELVNAIKTKRYTYNRLMRMLIHVLIGLTKEDKLKLQNNEYIRILGLNSNGQSYLNKIKKNIHLPLTSKITNINSKIKDYELRAASIYELLTNINVLEFEYSNKPIKIDK
ncbi:MAG: nucleotidyltransferase [Erysipelotrichales bacterium]|nr:nucleotidyltransferase [Erysipelotrichales bacterium]